MKLSQSDRYRNIQYPHVEHKPTKWKENNRNNQNNGNNQRLPAHIDVFQKQVIIYLGAPAPLINKCCIYFLLAV